MGRSLADDMFIEAMFFGKPMLVLPPLGGQRDNAHRVESVARHA